MGAVRTFSEVLVATEAAREAGKIVVATNGCFDILHVGHVRNLAAAKTLGDVLVVGINSDTSVRANKGAGRPIICDTERAEVVAALDSVDYVFVFDEPTPFSWIQVLRPHVHTKGGGADILAHPDLKTQREVVEKGGGALVLTPHHDGRSTTTIIDHIKRIEGLGLS